MVCMEFCTGLSNLYRDDPLRFVLYRALDSYADTCSRWSNSISIQPLTPNPGVSQSEHFPDSRKRCNSDSFRDPRWRCSLHVMYSASTSSPLPPELSLSSTLAVSKTIRISVRTRLDSLHCPSLVSSTPKNYSSHFDHYRQVRWYSAYILLIII